MFMMFKCSEQSERALFKVPAIPESCQIRFFFNRPWIRVQISNFLFVWLLYKLTKAEKRIYQEFDFGIYRFLARKFTSVEVPK